MKTIAIVVLAMLCCVPMAVCQTETATLSGRVADPSGAAISGANVEIQNVLTGRQLAIETNSSGLYVATALQPGMYRVIVSNSGFKQIVKPNVVLNVQDNASLNFSMTVGSASETVTVEGGAPLINTLDATVSTVVDRNFAENLPMNGRSFQSLIQLTPGVVLTASNNQDNGQFSVNGQRAASNYWTVDGVSGNVGISSTNQAGNGVAGAMPSLSVLGGTNSLVSVDAMQEFRIQTSTFAPEFGRTPGAQISVVTRSGTNQLHGTGFDYLRNDALDASDWFNGFENSPPLPKAKERQNDFGGTLGGPILKDRTFFFFSYEGLRLRLPETTLTSVPDLAARQNATAAVQPFLNAYPLPNGIDNPSTGIAQFNASYSNAASIDAYSLRLDHRLISNINFFGRYDYSPSHLVQRGDAFALSSVFPATIIVQTGTIGATWAISSTSANDVRFNYSTTNASSRSYLDNFGGAIPLTSLPFPSPFTQENSAFQFFAFSTITNGGGINIGPQGDNLQRQVNIVDGISIQRGSHALKFGADFRRLSPIYRNPAYDQEALFFDIPSQETGNVFLTFVSASRDATLYFRNLGAFGQDTWRITPRLTITYGVRWDVDFAPYSSLGYLAVTGFNLSDLSHLALAPAGTSAFKTTYGNVAPRIGLSYQLNNQRDWQTVVRTGGGVFYDLATQETGNLAYYYYYPYGANSVVSGGGFPQSPPLPPPAITIADVTSGGIYGFDPNLKLPYTLQWNATVEQALGSQQTLSASYVGSVGRRLIQTANVNSPNADFASAYLVTNAATSDYNALQLQFNRRLSHGLQSLASYTWSHSIDDASAGSLYGNTANALLPGVINQNRGPSDFDVRHSFSLGTTYQLPSPNMNAFADAVLGGWSIQSIIQARSALPINLFDGSLFFLKKDYAVIRPDVVVGKPFYLFGSQYPGGKAFNPGAFTDPPFDTTGNPIRQGDLGRNSLRGFGAWQWDLAAHRNFRITESVKLQFRAEMFNILNHPNFAPPVGDISNATQFGISQQTLGQYLGGGNIGRGGFSPLYQIGGPRSVQFGLKLQF
jgi:hypothetical protein